MTDTPNTVWIKAYTPDGWHVSVTIALEPSLPLGSQIMGYIGDLKAAGMTPREQGIEQGESVEAVSAVARRSKGEDDGTVTPIIDLYSGDNNYKTLSIYLNSADDVRAFEAATGLTVADLPEFDSTAAVERKDTLRWNKYARTPVHPTRFVHNANPAYTGKEGDMKPKRKFVRWMPDTVASSPPPASGSRSDDQTPTKAQALFDTPRRPAVENAVANEATFTVYEIVVGKSGNSPFLDFRAPLADDGSPGITARYWGKTGSRLAGLQEAIGSKEWQALKEPGTVKLEYPISVTAKREGQYWGAERVSAIVEEEPPTDDIVF